MPMRSLAVRPSASRVLTRPLVVLTACLAVAGLGLGWFMVRAVLQERAIAAREAREATEAAARRLADAIPGEFERLARDITVPARPASTPGPAGTSGPGAQAAAPTGAEDVILLLVGARDIRAWPERRLLYTLGSPGPTAEPPADPDGRAAEHLEVRAKDYAAAAAAYRSLLARTTQPARRLDLQRRLARTLRKAKRPADALVVLSEIVDAHPGPGPAEVAAVSFDRCALLIEQGRPDEATPCATSFYGDLVDARWPIDRERYQFYAHAARDWLDAPSSAGAPLAALRDREAARLALTEAAVSTLHTWRARADTAALGLIVAGDAALPVIAAWRTTAPGEHALLLMGPAAAAARVWQPLASLTAPDHRVSVSANGVVLFPRSGAVGSESEAAAPSASATSNSGAIVWRVNATPDLARTRRTELSLASNLYLGTLGLMMVAVALAGYFAVRTVRKEIEVARLKAEFVSAVSHEFRSPLSAISHLSELLDLGRVRDEERQREYFRLIRGESARLRRLVENLLDFARIEEGRQQFRLERLDTRAWLRRAVDEFAATPAAAGREIAADIGVDLPEVLADEAALTTALDNLLDNAVKYSSAPAPVRVEAASSDDGIEIRVTDRGSGIPPEDLPHLFDRFYRGRDAGSVSGAGLGLALVQRIVAAHGGRVTVESRVGEGSTFHLYLPAAPPDPSS